MNPNLNVLLQKISTIVDTIYVMKPKTV